MAMSVTDPRKLEDNPSQQNTLRSFFWDSVVLYAAFAIIGIAAVNTVFQFVQNVTLSCNIPDTANVSAEYINNYCYGEISYIRYITAFNVVIGTLIAGPHYLWLNVGAEKFAFFVVLTKNMDPTPNSETGSWSEENNVIVEQVENFYRHRHFVLVTYFVKVITQLLFAVLGLLLTILVFNDTNGNFYCPRTFSSSTIPNFWPLNHRVECTFATLEALTIIRWIDVAFLALITPGLIFGSVNCLFFGKTVNESTEIAKFFLKSALPYEFYAPDLLRSFTVTKSDLDFLVTGLFRGSGELGVTFWRILRHRRKKDLEFKEMAMVSIHREKATDEELQLLLPLTRNKHLLSILAASNNNHFPEPLEDTRQEPTYLATPLDLYSRERKSDQVQLEADVRGAVLSFAAFCPRREVAVVLEYGKASKCVPLALARAFRKVILVNFQYIYKNYDRYVTTWEYPLVNYTEMTLHPYTVLNQDADEYKEFTDEIKYIWKGQAPPATSHLKVSMEFDPTTVKLQDDVKVKVSGAAPPTEQATSPPAPPTEQATPTGQASPPGEKSDFIVVCPIEKEKEYEVSATTLFLDYLAKERCLSDQALLLSVYPLTIGGRNVWKKFSEYMPPDQQEGVSFHFQPCECQHETGTDTPKKDSSYLNLDKCCKCNQDSPLQCGKVPCVFKFSLYERCEPTAAVEQEAEDEL